MTSLSVEIYKTKSRVTPWTWRLRHRNGKVIANAAETYDNAGNARRAGRGMGKHLGCAVYVLDIDGQRVETLLEAAAPLEARRVPPENERADENANERSARKRVVGFPARVNTGAPAPSPAPGSWQAQSAPPSFPKPDDQS